MNFKIRPQRRNVLKVGLAALLTTYAARVSAATGFYVLDTHAIPVRRPELVLLEAITFAGERLIAVGEHGVIIYSDDHGASWNQAAVPVDVTLTCVAFATPTLGWAAGHFGVILNTRDGGLTWQMQLNGVQANQLTMAAAQAAAANGSASPGAPYALRRANIFVQGGPNKPFLSMIAFSPSKVIVFGAFRMTMLTLDGGDTWVDWSLSIGDALSHNLYAAAMVGQDIYVVGEAGEVFRSSDNGNSFPEISSPAPATLFGVVGVQNSSILVFGVAGNIFRSTDRGLTWQNINLNTQDDLTAGYVLADGSILIATEAGALFSSQDNGITFEPVTNGPPMAIFGIAETADKGILFVGSSGVIRVPSTTLTV